MPVSAFINHNGQFWRGWDDRRHGHAQDIKENWNDRARRSDAIDRGQPAPVAIGAAWSTAASSTHDMGSVALSSL